jgi:hypothetical protein
VAWLYDQSELAGRPPLWEDAGVVIRDLLFFVGPLLGGLAAWTGGRDSRSGMEEALTTAPRSRTAQLFLTWGGTLAWGAVAYLLAITAVLGVTYLRGAAGWPNAWPAAVALLGLFAHAAVGFAAGYLVRSRFTVPLVAVGMLLAMAAPGFFADRLAEMGVSMASVTYLSPVGYGARPNAIYLLEALFLAGVGSAALAALAVRSKPGLLSWAVLLAATGVAMASVPMVLWAGAVYPEGLP